MTSRVGIWLTRNLHWLLLSTCAAVILFLGWAGTYLIQNQDAIAERQMSIGSAQQEQLRIARAVVRCSLREELRGLKHISDKLNLGVQFQWPNTTGINCDDMLDKPIYPKLRGGES